MPINTALHKSVRWPPACPALPHRQLWLPLKLSCCMQQNDYPRCTVKTLLLFSIWATKRALRRYELPFGVSGTLQVRMSHAVNKPDRPPERDIGPKLEGSGKLARNNGQPRFKKKDMNKSLRLNCWQKCFLLYFYYYTSHGDTLCQGELVIDTTGLIYMDALPRLGYLRLWVLEFSSTMASGACGRPAPRRVITCCIFTTHTKGLLGRLPMWAA